MFKHGLSFNPIRSTADGVFTQFEYIDGHLISKGHVLRLAVVYRPPPSSKNGLTFQDFMQEWPLFLENFTSSNTEVITGDLNFHVDDTCCKAASAFVDTLSNCGMQQLVKDPTHVKGHTLDVVITKDTTSIQELRVVDPTLCDQHGNLCSDHCAVTFVTTLCKPVPITKQVVYRKWKSIEKESFREAIRDRLKDAEGTTSVGHLLETYESTLRDLVNAHVPQRR